MREGGEDNYIIHPPPYIYYGIALSEDEGLLHTEREQEEGVLKGGISDTIITPRGSTMPRIHIHLQEKEMVIRLETAELRYILRGLMEEDLRVIEPACDQEVRIALCRDVVIGRVAEHIVEVLRIIRIPPTLRTLL